MSDQSNNGIYRMDDRPRGAIKQRPAWVADLIWILQLFAMSAIMTGLTVLTYVVLRALSGG